MCVLSLGRVLERQQQKLHNDDDGEAKSSNNAQNHNKTKETRESGKDTLPNICESLTTNGLKDNTDDEVYEDDTDIDEVSIY